MVLVVDLLQAFLFRKIKNSFITSLLLKSSLGQFGNFSNVNISLNKSYKSFVSDLKRANKIFYFVYELK